ncbi:phage holin family protein [Bradyrhizobium sp. STM 3557]|uniref:phage holin family protein n=1 Tax=Bradyrhizobium sp. STM 3557 TaxID=578920 RepID=UPI00388F73BF
MLAPPGDLLRAGFEMKLNRVKRATRSYMRDRTRQATGTVTSYAVAAGLFAVAGIFLIAACLVGLDALFRWVELKYGPFPAFGVIGGILVLLAAACAGFAMFKLRRPAPKFPSLGSRLRVAIASPLVREPAADEVDPDTVPLAPSSSHRIAARNRSGVSVPVALSVAALLLGWAAARRRQHRGHDRAMADARRARDDG